MGEGDAVKPFIEFMRSTESEELLKDRNAYFLLAHIAWRARWHEEHEGHGLGIGEAMIGDHKQMGMTRGEYRAATIRLTDYYHHITTRRTNRGLIATLITATVWNIKPKRNNHQDNHPATIQQPSSDHPTTTNTEGKKERKKEGKNEDIGVTLRSTPRQELASADNGTEPFAPETVVTNPMPRKDMLQMWWLVKVCAGNNVPKMQEITDERWKKFTLRAKEGMWEARDKIEAEVQASELLRSGKWFNFDWLVKNKANWRKITEGNYSREYTPQAQRKVRRI